MTNIIFDLAGRISMLNHVSPVFLKIMRETVQLEGALGNLTKGFEKMGLRAGLVLGGGVGAGVGIVASLVKATEHAAKLAEVQNQLAISGEDNLKIQEATAKAIELQQKYGVKVAQALSDIRETRMPLGSIERAIAFAEPFEQMRTVFEAFKEGPLAGTADKAKGAMYAAARSGELRGLQTPEQFHAYFDAMTKWIIASGGKLGPQDFLAATKYGRIATQGWSPEFVEKWLPTAIQEMGGSQAGTGVMSMFRNIAQGHTPLGATQALNEYGLLTDPSKLVYNKKGEIKGFRYGAVEQSGLLVQDPYQWAQDVLAPALRKKFGQDISPKDPRVIGAIGDMFSNRMAAQMGAILTLQPWRFEKDAAMAGQTMGLGAAKFLIKNDPYRAMERFTAAWDALLTALGKPLVGPATDAMNKLADAINNLSSVNLADETVRFIGSFGDKITDAFKAMFDKIGEWIPEWLKNWALKQKASFGGAGFGDGGMYQRASLGGAAGGGLAGGGSYNVAKAYDLMKAQGATDEEARTFAALAQPESRGNPFAHNANVRTGDNSYGLWQINMLGAMGPQRRAQFGLKSNEDLYDPATNARVALAMKRRAGGYGDWSTYNKGLHRPYLKPYSGGKGQQDVHVHVPVTLDGKMIASNSVTHILKGSEHSRQSPYFDGYGHFAGADRQTATA